MVLETFHCTKEKRVPRKIHTLHHDGRIISQQEEIVQVMQQWYEETAERVTPQTTRVSGIPGHTTPTDNSGPKGDILD
jgi:hypothetical protein